MAPAGPNTPEPILLERIAAGDSGAFSELGGRHRQEMLSVASVIAGPDAAEDAVQKALIDAHRWLAKGESPDDVGAWLRTIARNRALDELRTAARSPKLPAPTPVASPHETIERRDTIRGVLAGVRSLPALQRAAILAQAMEGKSHAEIAAEHGVSTGAVRAAIPRARRSLRGWAGALIPWPLLGWTRRGIGRLRDLSVGGAAGATAGLATVAVAAAVSAGLIGGTGAEGDPGAAEPPATVTAGLNQESPPSESTRSATRGKRPERNASSPRLGGPQDQSPSTTSAPAAPSPATPPAPDPVTPSPSDPPAPPPAAPEPPPEPPTPPPPPAAPAGACGSMTALVPCVLETVHGVLKSLP